MGFLNIGFVFYSDAACVNEKVTIALSLVYEKKKGKDTRQSRNRENKSSIKEVSREEM